MITDATPNEKNEKGKKRRKKGIVAVRKALTRFALHCSQSAYEAVTSGRHEEAVQRCTQALKADPSNTFGRKFRAQLLFDREDMVKALKDLWLIPKATRTPDVWSMGGQ